MARHIALVLGCWLGVLVSTGCRTAAKSGSLICSAEGKCPAGMQCLAGRCYSGNPDLSGVVPPDLTAVDLTGVAPPDLTGVAPPDLTGVTPPDLTGIAPEDLSATPDDMAVATMDDLTAPPPDLTVVDLKPILDLIPPADLMPKAVVFSGPTDKSTTQYPGPIRAGDVNSDTYPDIVVASHGPSNMAKVGVFLNNGNGTFANPNEYAIQPEPGGIAIGEFNNNAKVDIVVVVSGSSLGTPHFLSGNNDGTFVAATNATTLGGVPGDVAAFDFNVDGKLDLVAPDWGSGLLRFSAGNNDGTFGTATTKAAGAYAIGIALADFDKDTKMDVLTGNINGGNVSFFKGGGDGTFANAQNTASGTNTSKVAFGFFDSDANLDIVVARQVSLTSGIGVNVLKGNGDGTFQTAVPYTGPGTNDVAVADFNGDGKLDIVAASDPGNCILIFLGKGDGTFHPGVSHTTGVKPARLAVADFDKNNKPDVAVTNGDSSSFSVFLNITP